jgi:CHASE2 domain-containing sensor protein
MILPQLLRNTWSDVKTKGPRYWLFAGAFIAAGVATSNYFNEHLLLLGPRYAAYQMLQRVSPQAPSYAKRAMFVAVGDEEFWKGPLERRIPVKRDYLARLVEVLDAANPEVLAVDYALRSPVADGSLVETPAYLKETEKLIAAVEAAKNSVIVLPATVDENSYDERTQTYALDSSIFGAYQFKNPRVKMGYLNLPRDIRLIPLAVRVRGCKERIGSFSQQIAVTLDPKNRSARREEGVLFGSFMPIGGFDTIPASKVLADPEGAWRAAVRCRAVIVGSFAHKDAYRRGPYIDGFQTPVGIVAGAAVHANYVEALVHERVFPVIPAWASDVVEVLLSLWVSVLFARRIAPFKKAGHFVILVGVAFLFSYFLLQNLAVVFDPVLPVLFVALHFLGERAFAPHRPELAQAHHSP